MTGTVVTQGFVNPPFSNSCAEIFRMGVAPPDPAVDLEPVDRDLEYLESIIRRRLARDPI